MYNSKKLGEKISVRFECLFVFLTFFLFFLSGSTVLGVIIALLVLALGLNVLQFLCRRRRVQLRSKLSGHYSIVSSAGADQGFCSGDGRVHLAQEGGGGVCIP